MYVDYLEALSKELRNRKLTDLEVKIITLLQKSISYTEIAKMTGYEDGYIGDVARGLYSIIAEKHNVKVKKSNLFSTLDQFIGVEKHLLQSENIHYISHLASGVIEFKQDIMLFNLSIWWLFNATKKSLISKDDNCLIIPLENLQPDKLGKTLLELNKKELRSEAISELLKIVDNYFKC